MITKGMIEKAMKSNRKGEWLYENKNS
jgi:hypothetical protein